MVSYWWAMRLSRFNVAEGNESGFVGKVFYVEGESTDFMIRVQCLAERRT